MGPAHQQLFTLGKEQFHNIIRWHPEFRTWVGKHALSYKVKSKLGFVSDDGRKKQDAKNKFRSISKNIGELHTRHKARNGKNPYLTDDLANTVQTSITHILHHN
jgi:hypothetical protein